VKRTATASLVIATASTAVLGGTLVAFANWTVPSKLVKYTVHTAKMPRGVTPAVGKVGRDAVLTWFPQDIAPGTPMQSYIVTRHSVTDAGLIEEFPPTTATTFTDDGVGGGKWYWTLRPKYEQWEGEEGRKSDRLTFPAIPAGPLAMKGEDPTATAEDTEPTDGTATEPTGDAGTPGGAEPSTDVTEPPAEPTTDPIEPPVVDPPATTDPQLENTVTAPATDGA
jgi:hypothetical protein